MATSTFNVGMSINFTRNTITAYAKTLEKILADSQVRQAIGEEESYKMGLNPFEFRASLKPLKPALPALTGS